jgi:hypothetical protein
MARPIGKPFLAFSGLIMAIGAYLASDGGRQHPMISEKMGKFGSDPFMLAFAKLMVEPKWQAIHTEILISTMMMAVGVFAVVLLAHEAGESQWTPLGCAVLAMSAVLWVCTYIYDGFVSPHIAQALISAQGDNTLSSSVSQTFASGQWFTIKIGLWAWLTWAFGTAAICVGLLAIAKTQQRGWFKVELQLLAGTGLFLGAWTLVAWLAGGFDPGPMVSKWWLPANIATTVWYQVLGIAVILRAFNVHLKGRRRPAAEVPAGASTAVPEQVAAG